MRFRKMHGLGNDFVILDHREIKSGMLTNAQIQQICDRHFGVGCDQLVLLEPSQKGDIFARFYNGDGSESGACGNATRCLADLYFKETGQTQCVIETGAGLLPCFQSENGLVTVDMGAPKLEWAQIPLSKVMDTLALELSAAGLDAPVAVNMGNPHCVFFVDSLEGLDVEKIGSFIENNALFPERTNVEFVQVLDRSKLRQITWERGAGVTLACGSGACAVAVASVRRDLTDRSVEVNLDGGALHIEWRESDGHVLMTGPVAYVFEGQLKVL